MPQKNEILSLLYELVQIPSDTDSPAEAQMATLILDQLQKNSKLQKNNTLGLEKIPDDSHGRSIVWGLLKGEGSETVILLNHHDVVDSLDYGGLQSLAYEPDLLKEALKKQKLPKEVRDDLESGEWLFGRGTADMKGGLAIQLRLLEKLAENQDFKGNLLFLSVPDEENLSLGMRHGTKLLEKLSREYNLDYRLLINSEPHERKNGRLTIYDSSVGKTMAVVYVQGQKAHIGKVFEGLNPTAVLSRMILHTELNSDFSDSVLGESSTPPSWSFARDFKKNYDASIPEAAGGYLSFLTLESSPKNILEALKAVGEKSFNESVAYLQTQYKKTFPGSDRIPDYPTNIKYYEELLHDAMAANPEKAQTMLYDSHVEIRTLLDEGKISMPESNFIIIERLLKLVDYNTPTIVIALSPPFYPHTTSTADKNYTQFKSVVETALSSYDVEFEHYFMGISDLSYIGLHNEDEIVPYVARNMPLWNDNFYTIPFDSMKALAMPTLILGPWGKDLHQKTERVFIQDLVENVPSCIETLILSVL